MELAQVRIETDGGPWAEHNYPCPVYSFLPSVLELNTGIFQPSWVAQKRGWRLVKADTFVRRLALKYLFNQEPCRNQGEITHDHFLG